MGFKNKLGFRFFKRCIKSIVPPAAGQENVTDDDVSDGEVDVSPPSPFSSQFSPPPSPVFLKRARSFGTGEIRKLEFTEEEEEAPKEQAEEATLVSLVVSISDGNSYDELFTSVAQKVGEGERAATYAAVGVDPNALQQLVEFGADAPICQTQADAASLAADLALVEPQSVVFNWECCSGCSRDRFQCTNSPLPLIAFLLSRGFMGMVSDFSLGALIEQWDAQLLGANPFVKVGEFSDSMNLGFEPATLAACDDSAQLQVLGELCQKGEVQVHALGGTKAFAVDPSVPRSVKVLTVVTHVEHGMPARHFLEQQERRTKKDGKKASKLLSKVGNKEGLAGHCIIDDFEGGGRLLCACPHWIELSRMDAEESTVLAVAMERYGAKYTANLRSQLDSLGNDYAKRSACSSAIATRFVHQSSAARQVPKSRMLSVTSSF